MIYVILVETVYSLQLTNYPVKPVEIEFSTVDHVLGPEPILFVTLVQGEWLLLQINFHA